MDVGCASRPPPSILLGCTTVMAVAGTVVPAAAWHANCSNLRAWAFRLWGTHTSTVTTGALQAKHIAPARARYLDGHRRKRDDARLHLLHCVHHDAAGRQSVLYIGHQLFAASCPLRNRTLTATTYARAQPRNEHLRASHWLVYGVQQLPTRVRRAPLHAHTVASPARYPLLDPLASSEREPPQ